MRLDQTSSDSQCSPTDELSSKGTTDDLIETIESSSADIPDATLNTNVDTKPFEEAGVFITDDDITVDVSNTTGLRKTGFSDDLYSDSLMKKTFSKIPRSPMARRKSVDSCSVNSDNVSNTGLPSLSRKMPVYRSVRKTSSPNIGEMNGTNKAATTSPKKDNITWNGRLGGATTKKRPTIATESFTPITNKNSGSTSNLSQKGTTPFQRNTDNRLSRCQYDQNGRRIVKSTNTSPVKQATSPLAQQILEAAENAKNDVQIFEKMKLLLSKYAVNKTGSKSSGSSNRSRSTATPSPIKNKDEFEDFTTAWVNSNGSLDRASNCCTPVKMHSKRSSAASSCDSTAYGKGDMLVTARRDRGVSRIPAPIRQNTELY